MRKKEIEKDKKERKVGEVGLVVTLRRRGGSGLVMLSAGDDIVAGGKNAGCRRRWHDKWREEETEEKRVEGLRLRWRREQWQSSAWWLAAREEEEEVMGDGFM